MSTVIPDPAVTDWVPLGNMPPAFVSGMVPLQDIIATGTLASFDFQNIDQSFTWLQLRVSGRSDGAGTSYDLMMRVNNDSGNNYYDTYIQGVSTAAPTGGEQTSATQGRVGVVSGAGAISGYMAFNTIDINDYTYTHQKHFVGLSHTLWGSTSSTHVTRIVGGICAQTAAITRITLYPSTGNWIAGSRATLFGISATPQPVGGASIIPRYTSAQMTALVPFDGQVIDLIADATNGINWRLRYNANSASAYKWEFVGGPPMLSDVITNEIIVQGGSVYTQCPTDGPAIIVPRAGDYRAQFNAEMWSTASAVNSWTSIRHGAAGTSDNDSTASYLAVASQALAQAQRDIWLTALPASTDIHMYYKTSGANSTGNFRKRELRVTPIRVS